MTISRVLNFKYRSISLLILVVFLSFKAQSQLDVLFEFQAYPTGLIPGVRMEKAISDKSTMHLRLGYNWIRHRDLGVQDEERGDGFGFTLGYKRYFTDQFKGWNIGIKNDFWWNSIDWADSSDVIGQELEGTSEITVIQPTLEIGYVFLKNEIVFSPTIAFGFEWNVKTIGRPTGEGAILLIGFIIGKRF